MKRMNDKIKQKLVFSGSPEVAEYMQTLFESGELSKLLGANVSNIHITSESYLVNFSQCLQQNLTTAIKAGFEIIQDILEPSQLIFKYQRSNQNPISDEYIHLQSLQRLLQTNPEDPTAIDALLEIVQATQDEELRWQAIESLPQSGRHRLTNIIGLKKEELRLANHSIKLTVSAIKIADEKFSIFIKLYPAGEQTTLPIGIKLIVLDESGEIFDQVPDEEDEEYNEIKYKLTCDLGDSFNIKLALGSDSITESFSS